MSILEDLRNEEEQKEDELSSDNGLVRNKAEIEAAAKIRHNIIGNTENAVKNMTGETAAGTAAGAITGKSLSSSAGKIGTKAVGESAASGAVAGSVAGPAGTVAGVIASLALDVVKAAKKASDISLDEEDKKASTINMFVIVVVLFFFFITVVCGTIISKGTSSLLSVGQETEFQNTKYNGENMSQAGERYKENASSEIDDYNDKYPLTNTIMDYIWGTSERKGSRQVLHEAIRDNLKSTVLSLGSTIPDKTWDQERSMTYFYNQPWLYDVQVNNYEVYPTIRDVLENGYKAKYDDVNWAEVITILSQNTKADGSHQYALNWGECNYEDFLKFIESDRCKQYMYELGVKWIPIYTYETTITHEDGTISYETKEKEGGEYEDAASCSACPETQIFDGIEYTFTGFWTKTEVRPFGLRELYALADVNPEDNHVEFYQHTNYYMLDYTEKITRIYQRGKEVTFESGATANQLGPSYDEPRNSRSTIYNYLVNDPTLIAEGKAGTGRSCWYYIKDTYNANLQHIDYGDDPAYDSDDPPKSVTISGSLAEKLAYYFPDGLPTSAEEMQKYLTTVPVECLDVNGQIVTRNITVHKMVAESVQAAMHELAQSGFIVKGVGSYNWRDMVGASGKRSMHSYGLAIDINAEDNPFIKNGKVLYGTTWSPSTNPYAFSQDKADILIKEGWYWGGNWKSSKDYMHFSVTGY